MDEVDEDEAVENFEDRVTSSVSSILILNSMESYNILRLQSSVAVIPTLASALPVLAVPNRDDRVRPLNGQKWTKQDVACILPNLMGKWSDMFVPAWLVAYGVADNGGFNNDGIDILGIMQALWSAAFPAIDYTIKARHCPIYAVVSVSEL